tara:strand:+ start:2062 stop:2784 length:723 start_codon:yes stop_codon:yes gene_type:complete
MTILCYDLETNGFHGKILQFAFIGFNTEEERVIEFTEYVNPNEELNREATEVHGISSPQLAQMESFENYIGEITELIEDVVLIGFNNRTFDDPRMARELGITIEAFNQHIRCSLDVMQLCSAHGLDGRLEAIANQFGLQNPMPHDARGDVGVTLRVLYRLLSENEVELPLEVGCSTEEVLLLIEQSVDIEDESYLIIETEPVTMYTSMVEGGIVQFGPHAGKSMDELRELDEFLWRQLSD